MSTGRFTLPQREFAGYIFDLDGTLVESMPLHYRAWRETLRHHGAAARIFEWPEFLAHGGMAAVDIVRELNSVHGLHFSPEGIAEEKRAVYASLLQAKPLPVIPETVDLVRSLRSRGIPYAIGTGSLAHAAQATLHAADIAELFPIVITPELVPHGKPAPDIFLKAAKAMGVEAKDCVVFEDAEPGLRAARAAGMESVRVFPLPSTHPVRHNFREATP